MSTKKDGKGIKTMKNFDEFRDHFQKMLCEMSTEERLKLVRDIFLMEKYDSEKENLITPKKKI